MDTLVKSSFAQPKKLLLTPEQEAYKIAIEVLAKNNDATLFNNADPAHAAIVLGNIFKNASDYVKIFAGDFNGTVSNNVYYLNSLKSYLEKNKSLTIIFENEPNKDSLALSLLKEYNTNKISVRKLRSVKSPETVSAIASVGHFTVADGKMFRIETEKQNYKAICSFNQPQIASTLENSFASLLSISEVYNN